MTLKISPKLVQRESHGFHMSPDWGRLLQPVLISFWGFSRADSPSTSSNKRLFRRSVCSGDNLCLLLVWWLLLVEKTRGKSPRHLTSGQTGIKGGPCLAKVFIGHWFWPRISFCRAWEVSRVPTWFGSPSPRDLDGQAMSSHVSLGWNGDSSLEHPGTLRFPIHPWEFLKTWRLSCWF